MKVVVIGVVGFFGYNFVDLFCEQGYEVMVVDCVVHWRVCFEVIWVEVDIFDFIVMWEVFDGVDVVYYFVVKITLVCYDDVVWMVNMKGVWMVVEVAFVVGVCWFVYCSFVYFYDQCEDVCGGWFDEFLFWLDDATLLVYDWLKWVGE